MGAVVPQMKFPSSPEIKRILAAVEKAGIEIGSVDIRADGVTIHPPTQSQSEMSPYEKWKAKSEPRSARN